MIKGSALVILLVVFAQVPSCGGETSIVGYVEEKHQIQESGRPTYVIVINKVEYSVPLWFWNQVGIGDLVKFEGGVWTIVRKAGR